MGVSGIPVEAIIAWMKAEQIPHDMRTFYKAVIKTIDNHFVFYQSNKNKPKKTYAIKKG